MRALVHLAVRNASLAPHNFRTCLTSHLVIALMSPRRGRTDAASLVNPPLAALVDRLFSTCEQS
jgi:hypothetical protein